MTKSEWKKQIRFYGALTGFCLVVAAGVQCFMGMSDRDPEKSATVKSLKAELESYRKTHGEGYRKGDLTRIWNSYEGKLSPEEIRALKRDYGAELDREGVEALKRSYEVIKKGKP